MRYRIRFGIAQKISLLTIALVLITALLMSWLILRQGRRILLDHEVVEHDHDTQFIGRKILADIQALREDARALARDPEIVGHLLDRLQGEGEDSCGARIETRLARFLQENPGYRQVRIVGRTGTGDRWMVAGRPESQTIPRRNGCPGLSRPGGDARPARGGDPRSGGGYADAGRCADLHQAGQRLRSGGEPGASFRLANPAPCRKPEDSHVSGGPDRSLAPAPADVLSLQGQTTNLEQIPLIPVEINFRGPGLESIHDLLGSRDRRRLDAQALEERLRHPGRAFLYRPPRPLWILTIDAPDPRAVDDIHAGIRRLENEQSKLLDSSTLLPNAFHPEFPYRHVRGSDPNRLRRIKAELEANPGLRAAGVQVRGPQATGRVPGETGLPSV